MCQKKIPPEKWGYTSSISYEHCSAVDWRKKMLIKSWNIHRERTVKM